MPELLLELLSEEIPARMQARAADDLKRLVTDGLKEAGLEFSSADSYVTPRRLALVVDGLPEKTLAGKEERRGPKVDAPEKAIQGFLKSLGRNSVDDEGISIRESDKGKFYYFEALIAPKETSRELPSIIDDALDALPWQKSMRWGQTGKLWVRPLKRILAVFNGEVIDLDYDLGGTVESIKNPTNETSIRASATTVGHRFLAPKEFAVKDFTDYKEKLRKAFVVVDHVERREIIEREANKLAKNNELTIEPDYGLNLLNEVAGLVEWPVVRMGSIDQEFMDIPEEVLFSSMSIHQKYLSLLNNNGKMAPNFIVVANMESQDGGKAIIAGNERVLRARLSDARFFWNQDRKVPLESRVVQLEQLVFHRELGTIAEKILRLQALVREIAPYIPDCDVVLAERAALLCKADLVSEMVGEFPELQGIMGRYYALNDGEDKEVAEAIANHYQPAGPTGDCPKEPIRIAVALVDKIDTLLGFWKIGEKPTGSRDPFALRRAALGVIRLIIENGLRIPLAEIFSKSWFLIGEIKSGRSDSLTPEPVINDLLIFFEDRLKIALKGGGVSHDIISATFAVEKPGGGLEDDFVRLMSRGTAIRNFLDTEDGANLLTAFKRASNIVAIEEKKDKKTYVGTADSALLEQDEERALFEALSSANGSIAKALDEENFAEAMASLALLRAPVDAFFDQVTVNCDDAGLRENRLKMLSQIRSAMGGVADFSQIEG